LTTKEFALLAGKLRPYTDHLYLHLMGEPLVHPALDQLLGEAARLHFRVAIVTNGTLLPEKAQILLASEALYKVSISLHSLEANGGLSPGAYLEEAVAFARQAEQKGIVTVFRLWNLDGETPGQNRLNDAFLERIEAAFPGPHPLLRKGLRMSEKIWVEEGKRFDWPDLSLPERDDVRFCLGLRDQIGVLCDGTVVPCCLDHEGDLALGNLFSGSLADMLDSPRARSLYDGFSGGRAVHPLCRRCGFAGRFAKKFT